MLPEEFRDVEEGSNEFLKAMFEIDYGLTLNDLIVELDSTEKDIGNIEFKLAYLTVRRRRLCAEIIKMAEADCIVVHHDGENIAAQIDLDNDDVKIVSAQVEESVFDNRFEKGAAINEEPHHEA